MKIRFAMLAAACLLSGLTLASPVFALARYECKGLASETIVLTPYQDGSVNLSFDKGPVEATAKFSHHGDVFTVEFDNLNGVQGSMLIYILDTLTKNGYEFFRIPGKPVPMGAAKITCWWFQN